MANMLRPPSLGPIVGHTTDTSVRLWMRAAQAEGRTIGVAAIFNGRRPARNSARYLRLRREYDRTGWIDFEGLDADTEYTVRMGSLTLDTPFDAKEVGRDALLGRLPSPKAWLEDLADLPGGDAVAQFRTFPKSDAGADISFIFGSCRYPGLLWKKKKADAIFGAIRERFHPEGGFDELGRPRFFMMVGDQIYADLLNRNISLGRADTEEEFHERYVSAFGSPKTRELLQSTPTYMILDDHEIEDNWVQGRIKNSAKRALFNLAIGAYQSYQWSHSPRTYGKKLYYQFKCAGHPFFVLDERTQRIRDDNDQVLEDNHLLGRPLRGHHDERYRGQVDLFCDWLRARQESIGDAPKFVVSASVFAPNTKSTIVRGGKDVRWKSDSWPAFPETRKQILETIVKNSVQNVVFLSGDIHVSNVAEISFSKGGQASPLKAFSITSSAFYWPFPFADGDPLNYVHDSEREGDGFEFGDGYTMHYKAWNFEQEDNFTQVTIERRRLRGQAFDKRGKRLGRTTSLELA